MKISRRGLFSLLPAALIAPKVKETELPSVGETVTVSGHGDKNLNGTFPVVEPTRDQQKGFTLRTPDGKRTKLITIDEVGRMVITDVTEKKSV